MSDKIFKEQLKGLCVEHWWNFGKKTLSYKGSLEGLLKNHSIKFRKHKTEREGIFKFYFTNQHGLSFSSTGTVYDFRNLAKTFIQMELVRMGDKSQLTVYQSFRPLVTVNH